MSRDPGTQPPGKKEGYYLPNTYLYSRGHLWVSVNDLRVTLGITEYAFDLVFREYFFLQLPDAEDVLNQGEVMGAIDAIKVAVPIVSPLSGRVTEVNDEVLKNPRLPLTSAYSRGWLLRLEIASPIELRGLMRAAEYREFLAGSDTTNFLRQL